ncbi:peptidoglycan-binding domain-containing protein [Streptomyces sp. NPDC005538]|uniref:peptidoglycan-binding domain-containing protein n=1 Tax=unclassified Streptomyces TaxID=2593676 RepID=UPI0033A81D29
MSFRTQVAAGVTVAVIVAGLHANGSGSATTSPAPMAVSAVRSTKVSCGNYNGAALTREGDAGARVREVQCLLAFRGWFGAGVNGRYEKSVYLAVRAFQSWDDLRGCAIPLNVDGIVDPRTWNALHSGDGCPTG